MNYINHEAKKEIISGAPNHFVVINKEANRIVGSIHFQHGDASRCNGVTDIEVLKIILKRLRYLQGDESYRCDENDAAIDGVLTAINAIEDREARIFAETHNLDELNYEY